MCGLYIAPRPISRRAAPALERPAGRDLHKEQSGAIYLSTTRFEIFNGNVLPGNHTVNVELVYRGNGTLFSYIDGYLFKIRSNYTFFASKGRITKIKVVGYEKGGITTDLEQKPYVRYEVQQHRYSRENLEKAKEGGLEGEETDE